MKKHPPHSKLLAWSLGFAIPAYYLLPFFALKLVALLFAIWALSRLTMRNPAATALVVAGALAAMFGLEFLWSGLPTALASSSRSPGLWAATLATTGALWLALATPRTQDIKIPVRRPVGIAAAATLAWTLLQLNVGPLTEDLTFLGDETYHVSSSVQYGKILQDVLACPLLLMALALWAGAGIVLACRKPVARTTLALWSTALLPILALGLQAIQPKTWDTLVHFIGAPLRYPATEWLVTAALTTFSLDHARDDAPFMIEAFRFLPLAALFALSLCLLADRRWAPKTRLLIIPAALAAALPLSIPAVHFHATLLYLELPLAVAAFLAIWDAKHLLSDDFRALTTRWSWPALLCVGFTKESAAPLLAAVVASRLLVRTRDAVRAGGWRALSSPRLLAGELAFIAACGFPLALFLGFRMTLPSIRHYGAQWDNLLDLPLQLKYLAAIASQFGVLCIPALCGALLLAWRRRGQQLLLSAACFSAVYLFYLCDNKVYLGLARFDLLFLPPLLLLSWECLSALAAWRYPAAIAVAAVNLALSPVSLDGARQPFGNSEERWYPFSRALDELLPQIGDNGKILLANMPTPYSFVFVTKRAQSHASYRQVASSAARPQDNLAATVAFASAQGMDAIILRCDNASEAPPQAITEPM